MNSLRFLHPLLRAGVLKDLEGGVLTRDLKAVERGQPVRVSQPTPSETRGRGRPRPGETKGQAMIKTVVELDLVGYSTIAEPLEKGLSVQTVRQLNEQIQVFVGRALKAVNGSRKQNVMLETGDGAILVFDQPSDAHRFAEVIQEATREHNKASDDPIVKRVFRIGAATGDIVMEPRKGGGYDIAGMTIARAVRFEAKASPGEIVVDAATLDGLTREQKQRYSNG